MRERFAPDSPSTNGDGKLITVRRREEPRSKIKGAVPGSDEVQ